MARLAQGECVEWEEARGWFSESRQGKATEEGLRTESPAEMRVEKRLVFQSLGKGSLRTICHARCPAEVIEVEIGFSDDSGGGCY